MINDLYLPIRTKTEAISLVLDKIESNETVGEALWRI